MERIKATNIDWSIDFDDDVKPMMDSTDVCVFADMLKMSVAKYNALSADEQEDLVRDAIHHQPILADRIFDLPSEVELPEGFAEDDEDAITEYLSNTYGFFVNGYALPKDEIKSWERKKKMRNEVIPIWHDERINQAYETYASVYLDFVDDNMRHFTWRNTDIAPVRELSTQKNSTEEFVNRYLDAAVRIIEHAIKCGFSTTKENLYSDYPMLQERDGRITTLLAKMGCQKG